MKKILIPAFAVVALTACDDEKHPSYAPTFSGFQTVVIGEQHAGNRIVANDSLQVTAVQATLGDLLYEAAYTWSVDYTNGENGKTRSLGKQTIKIVYDYDKNNPTIRFRVPDTVGTVVVSFTGEYQFSSSSFMDVSSQNGGITVTSSSLMARASGSKRIQVDGRR